MKWIVRNKQNNVKLTCDTKVQAMKWYKKWLKNVDRNDLEIKESTT